MDVPDIAEMNDGATRARSAPLAVIGVALGILGVIGYFAVVLRFGAWMPEMRNDAVRNWVVIALGLAFSVAAFIRARRRILAATLLGVNLSLAAAFFAILYVVSAVPPVSGPPMGAPAPDFALVDQAGKSVRLEDFRGAPLLLVFYRGHW